MKYTIAAALLAISTSAIAFQPGQGAEAFIIYQADEHAQFSQNQRSVDRNLQNDPSIHGRRTQTAYEQGGVGKGVTHDSAPLSIEAPEVYPIVRDEGQADVYPPIDDYAE